MSDIVVNAANDIMVRLMAVKEDELRIKYPQCDLVPGSLRKEVGGKLAGKIAGDLRCECGVTIRRATSDFFTWRGCPNCKSAKSKLGKAEKKVIAAEAEAKLRAEIEMELRNKLREELRAELEAERLEAETAGV